jgi:hypothetical protein
VEGGYKINIPPCRFDFAYYKGLNDVHGLSADGIHWWYCMPSKPAWIKDGRLKSHAFDTVGERFHQTIHA